MYEIQAYKIILKFGKLIYWSYLWDRPMSTKTRYINLCMNYLEV
jgi:hypothetical protein